MSSHVGVTAFTAGAGGLKLKNSDGQKMKQTLQCVVFSLTFGPIHVHWHFTS